MQVTAAQVRLVTNQSDSDGQATDADAVCGLNNLMSATDTCINLFINCQF